MSKLEHRKRRATFETLDVVWSKGRTRPVLVELHPTHMTLRLKGTRARNAHALTYSAAFMQALNAAQAAARREKAKAKKLGKAGK